MGRIKTTFVKRKTRELIKAHDEEFTTDFDQNKPIVEKFAKVPSKKLRNIIAGYITRMKKAQAD